MMLKLSRGGRTLLTPRSTLTRMCELSARTTTSFSSGCRNRKLRFHCMRFSRFGRSLCVANVNCLFSSPMAVQSRAIVPRLLVTRDYVVNFVVQQRLQRDDYHPREHARGVETRRLSALGLNHTPQQTQTPTEQAQSRAHSHSVHSHSDYLCASMSSSRSDLMRSSMHDALKRIMRCVCALSIALSCVRCLCFLLLWLCGSLATRLLEAAHVLQFLNDVAAQIFGSCASIRSRRLSITVTWP